MRRDPPPPSSPRICNRQPVLLESFCRKQSAYWRVWRTRWLVLTPDTLLCYRYKRGYALGHKPTESFSLRTCGTVRGIDQIAADRGPAFSLCTSEAYQAAWLLLAAAERPVVLDFVLPDSRLGGQHDSEEMRWLRNTWATEVVNARLLLQTCNSAYSAPNFHAFEPRNVRATPSSNRAGCNRVVLVTATCSRGCGCSLTLTRRRRRIRCASRSGTARARSSARGPSRRCTRPRACRRAGWWRSSAWPSYASRRARPSASTPR